MKSIAIWGNTFQGEHLEGLANMLESLRSEGFRVWIHSIFAVYLRQRGVEIEEFEIVKALPKEAECVFSFGGDGTFLQAAQWVGSSEVPILGINTGHLGYLTSYSLDEATEILEAVKADKFTREYRSVIEARCEGMPEGFWPYALNEVAVLKAATASMVTVHAEVDGKYLADYMSDGLVVSTPTGSTAYNLSIGGPILQPTLECLVLAPIAAHSLTMRPVVIGASSRIRLVASSRSEESRVSIDGRSFLMPCGREIQLCKAPFRVVVLRRPDSNFANLLRKKLGWGL